MGAKDPAPFDIETIRKIAGETVFARGQAYHRNGQVKTIAVGLSYASVQVSGKQDYRAEVSDAASRHR